MKSVWLWTVQSQSVFEGGIVYIVSGLKTFVETGAPMAVPAAAG